MNEYYAVVVLYNKKIQDSITISHLIRLQKENLHIIVLDNSTDDYVVENRGYFPIDLLTYYSMGENVGLFRTASQNIRKLCSRTDVQTLIRSYPKNSFSKSQYVYNFAMERRWIYAVYLLTWLQNKKKRIE